MSVAKLKMYVAAGLTALMLAGAGLPAIADPPDAQPAAGTSASTATVSQATFNQAMQAMRAQMVQLHAARDPAARAKLLDEHMRTMQRTMRMMVGGKGMAGARPMGPGMMQGSSVAGSGGMMARGQMMQMMMGQMMQHQQAMQGMGCSK